MYYFPSSEICEKFSEKKKQVDSLSGEIEEKTTSKIKNKMRVDIKFINKCF
jgi:hypothetical protein